MSLNIAGQDQLEKIVEAVPRRIQIERERMVLWLEERISAGRKKPVSEIVTLTPVLARLLLDRNPINRPIGKRNAADLAADIANGRFEFNGESIIISDTGILLDGQHRCFQVIGTQRPIETVLVFGPKDSARFTIDTGKSKTVSNYLHMKGRAYTHALGAAVNYHLQWRRSNFINYASSPNVPTKAEILAAADELPGFDTSVAFTATCMKTVRAHAVLSFCHYVFWKRSSREIADNFILKLIEGDGLQRTDPILLCRETLLRMGRGPTAHDRVELIFRAWNYHRIGAHVDRIRLSGKLLPKVER